MTLLIDAIERACIHRGGNPRTSPFRSLPVYEVTNVLPLFDDWSSYFTNQIPKRPPHDSVWVEWKCSDGVGSQGAVPPRDDAHSWSIGCCINLTEFALDAEGVPADSICLICRVFMRLDRSAPGQRDRYQGVIGCGDHYATLILSENCTKVASGAEHPVPPGGPFIFFPFRSSKHAVIQIWPAFMAFALLHCKNIETEIVRPSDRVINQKSNGRFPPKRDCYVLKLQLPHGAQLHSTESGDDESTHKKRFHLCRGHFKNLQDNRYKNKGWHWWPAHWKGSKTLGEIDKTYRLEANGSGQKGGTSEGTT